MMDGLFFGFIAIVAGPGVALGFILGLINKNILSGILGGALRGEGQLC
jgi:hypothetical protein|tara:strand:- start:484 stop:627 length:144 start_codon:yes stop_codon:yes gene_type:complete